MCIVHCMKVTCIFKTT